jgi:hypothetical protein
MTDRNWNQLRERARRAKGAIPDEELDRLIAAIDESPRTLFALLLDMAALDRTRAQSLVARYRELMATRGADGLAAAGHNLHEHGRALMDAEWVRIAIDRYPENPEGAWGIATAAAWHQPGLLGPAEIAFFDARAEDRPGDGVQMLLLVAGGDAARTDELVRRALEWIERHPVEALDGASLAGRHHDALLRPDLLQVMVRHVEANPEKGWEFLESVAYRAPTLFTAERLDDLASRAACGPKSYFTILHKLAVADADRRKEALDRFVALAPRFPDAAIYAAYYLAHNETELLRQDIVDLTADHFAAEAYKAYEVLSLALHRRPELLQKRHIEAAIANIPHATNWAFGFFRDALKLGPEFTPLCTLALFDALAMEPAHRAFNRAEMVQDILTIAQASHVHTELERTLREPPSVGSRRARAFMAILFRTRSRAHQHVLFEALRFVSRAVTWRDQNRTPLWDFLLFLLDESSDDAVSTAAAEQFLEGSFQLNFLMDRGADHDAFREQFDLRSIPAVPWPASVDFLGHDAELTRLFSVVSTLAKRFRFDLALSPIEDFERRRDRAQRELREIDKRIASTRGRQRENLQARRTMLARKIDEWSDPSRPVDPVESRRLAKRLRDALRAALSSIALRSVTESRRELFRERLKDALGREIDPSKVDWSILPAFLFFGHLGRFPSNRRYLARLIEDRIERRPSEWLWTEPAAAAWKARVAAAQPSIRFDRWRAEFSMEFDYRPDDAAQEKKRRIRHDLQRVRDLMAAMEVPEIEGADFAALREKFERIRVDRPKKATDAALEEIEQDLERVRIVQSTPDSDYEGKIRLQVETDPIQILFMGEYGFASCLSLRGSNVWSAVSNAIDVDKAILWAKEANGNVVGRRLIALTERGVLSYRTYTNRHGLALDDMFSAFVEAYAKHCGTVVTHDRLSPGPLLSDRWYDDGSI